MAAEPLKRRGIGDSIRQEGLRTSTPPVKHSPHSPSTTDLGRADLEVYDLAEEEGRWVAG